MSLHVLAKKTRALKGASQGKRFARYMTGSRISGCCNLSKPMPPGLRRASLQKACCSVGGKSKPRVDDKLIPKAPIKQMGYGIYLKSRTGKAGPGLLAGRLTSKTIGPNHQSPSLYTEQKKLDALKQPACCPKERTVVIDADANITSGPTTFVKGCTYVFTWADPLVSYTFNSVDAMSPYEWNACGCELLELVIVGSSAPKTYPVKQSNPYACSVKPCQCATTYKTDNRGRSWSTKKQRPAYVRGRPCCVTTKNMSSMSSGDYISRLKGKRACNCLDPAQKRVCGGGNC
jgi:hypothetical protein